MEFFKKSTAIKSLKNTNTDKKGFFTFWKTNKQPAPERVSVKENPCRTSLNNNPATLNDALNYVAPKKKLTLLSGSDGEHLLQKKFAATARAMNFYNKQALTFLAPEMQKFIERQEFLFISTSDAKGECDCTSKLGEAGFIRVLNEKHLMYPEYRGNGVFANLGNITENPHIGLLIIDFYQDTIGLHVNGKARIIENEELLQFKDNIPASVITEMNKEGKKKPERWIIVEVEEAYVQCSKHIPLLKKLDKRVDWGTDSEIEKKVDYFRLHDIPLYDRIGGDKAMEIVVDTFYQKVLQNSLVAPFFADVDMDAQREKQKGFLAMAFGGPYHYTPRDLRTIHQRLVQEMGLADAHFDCIMSILKETFEELNVHEKEINQILALLEATRDDILCR